MVVGTGGAGSVGPVGGANEPPIGSATRHIQGDQFLRRRGMGCLREPRPGRAVASGALHRLLTNRRVAGANVAPAARRTALHWLFQGLRQGAAGAELVFHLGGRWGGFGAGAGWRGCGATLSLCHGQRVPEVVGVDADGLPGALDGHPVDAAARRRDRKRQALVEGAGHEQGDIVLLGQGLEPCGEVHMRGEIGDVDLERAAHRSFDGPPKVQAKAQLDAATRVDEGVGHAADLGGMGHGLGPEGQPPVLPEAPRCVMAGVGRGVSDGRT
mmetsp:Transcript_25425/g.74155  ORF Transcript_25425/g.74155 Transcript_25425/m.74155 type:complete len:270 (-) Transcript_25425:280-1089(-)